ncbi:MAG: hypothetical protein RR359_02100 [Bacilli bacterium]
MSKSKFQWTEDQIEYLKANWGKEKAHSMKKRFGCTWYSVVKKAEELGLKLPQNNDWTEEDILQLKELSEKYHYEEIAKIMNRTPNAIYLKAKRMNIRLIQDRSKWTEEDEQLLRDYWGNYSIEQIAKKMKRSVFSLKVKAVRMGLGSMIANNVEQISISDISDILNVSLDRLYNTWIDKGLKIKNIKITKNKSYMAVTWKDLMEFLKHHQDMWDSRDLEKNILGTEPEWLKEKRNKDIEDEPQKYKRWDKEELETIKRLLLEGKSYKEISEIIQRSEWAIANMLRNLGYSYKLKRFWTGKEMIYLKENYPNMTQDEIAEQLGRTKKSIGAKAEELGIQKKLVKSKGDHNGKN